MKKIFIVLFCVILILSVVGLLYVYKSHRDVSTTDAINSFDSKELLAVFQDSDIENDKELLDQVIEVYGIATNESPNTVTIDDKIFIELDSSYKVKLNELVTIKGRCMGYDDLLEEVKIDQASIINILK